MAYIQSYKNQNYLIPPKITDLFSENHVCYLIDKLADEMDYSEFDQKYAGAGHPAYHPRIMIKLLMMAHIDGMRSSRRIAKNSQENVVYIYLAEKTQPDFRTISEFRKENLKLVKSVFREVNTFALEEGMIDLSHLSPDGTIIKANANDFKTINKKKIEIIDKWIDRYLDEAIKVDEEEDKLYEERSIHEMPPGLIDPKKRETKVRELARKIKESMKQKDVKKLEEIKEELHNVKHFMEENELNKFSFTDPDAQYMKSKKGRIELSYNAQLTTDKNGLIVANDVVQECDDRNQLLSGIEQVEQNHGTLPSGTIITADPGFENGPALAKLEERGFDLLVPGKNMGPETEPKKFAKANFTYDEEKNQYVCPEGKILTNRGKYMHSQYQREITIYSADFNDCQVCPNRQTCCKSQKKRVIHALPENAMFHRIRNKLETEEGKTIYAVRKKTVERSFGDIKHNKGFRRFLLRGLEKVKIEFNLVSIAHNLVMINNIMNKRRAAVSC